MVVDGSGIRELSKILFFQYNLNKTEISTVMNIYVITETVGLMVFA